MINDIEEIAAFLRSEKQIERNKGKRATEELLSGGAVGKLTGRQWVSLISSCIEFESKEIESIQKKKQELRIDPAAFLRKVVAAVIYYEKLTVTVVNDLTRHTLFILYTSDSLFSWKYKCIHTDILCDVLSDRVCTTLPSSFFKSIFALIADTATNKRQIQEGNSIKLLSIFCKSLSSDDSRCDSMVQVVVTWLGTVLIPLCKSDQTIASTAAPQLGICLQYIIRFESVDILFPLLDALGDIFLFVFSHFTSRSIRDPYYNHFAQSCLSLLQLLNGLDSSFAIGKNDGSIIEFCSHLGALLMSDEFMSGVILMHEAQGRAAKDVDNFAPSNNKLSIYFELCVAILCLAQPTMSSQDAGAALTFRVAVNRIVESPMLSADNATRKAANVAEQHSMKYLLSIVYSACDISCWDRIFISSEDSSQSALIGQLVTTIHAIHRCCCNANLLNSTQTVELYVIMVLFSLANVTRQLCMQYPLPNEVQTRLANIWFTVLVDIFELGWVKAVLVSQRSSARYLLSSLYALVDGGCIDDVMIWKLCCTLAAIFENIFFAPKALDACWMISSISAIFLRSGVELVRSIKSMSASSNSRMQYWNLIFVWIDSQLDKSSQQTHIDYDELYSMFLALLGVPKTDYGKNRRSLHENKIWKYGHISLLLPFSSLISISSIESITTSESLMPAAKNKNVPCNDGKRLSLLSVDDVDSVYKMVWGMSGRYLATVDDSIQCNQLGLFLCQLCLACSAAEIAQAQNFNGKTMEMIEKILQGLNTPVISFNLTSTATLFQGLYWILGNLPFESLQFSPIANLLLDVVSKFHQCCMNNYINDRGDDEFDEDENRSSRKRPASAIDDSSRSSVRFESFHKLFAIMVNLLKYASIIGATDKAVVSLAARLIPGAGNDFPIYGQQAKANYFGIFLEIFLTSKTLNVALTVIQLKNYLENLSSFEYFTLLKLFARVLESNYSEFDVLSNAVLSATLDSILFPHNQLLVKHSKCNWFVRLARLDAACAFSRCLQLLNASFRENYKSLFLESVMDSDIRVRIFAAEKVEAVLMLFHQHNRIYSAVCECIDNHLNPGPASSTSPVADCRSFWVNAPYAATLMVFGAQSPTLLPHALCDITKLFSSDNGVPMSRLFLLYLARRYHYSSIRLMFVNHFSRIIRRWFNSGPCTDGPLLLSKLPLCNILDISRLTTRVVVRELSSLVLCAISEIVDPKYRWELLLDVVSIIGLGSSDGDIIPFVRNCIPALRANHILLQCLEEQPSAYAMNAAGVNSFISRFESQNSTSTDSQPLFEECLAEIFISFLNFDAVTELEDANIASILTLSLRKVCATYKRRFSAKLILGAVNVVDILAELQLKLAATVDRSSHRRAMLMLVEIVEFASLERDAFLLEIAVFILNKCVEKSIENLDVALKGYQAVAAGCKIILLLRDAREDIIGRARMVLLFVYLAAILIHRTSLHYLDPASSAQISSSTTTTTSSFCKDVVFSLSAHWAENCNANSFNPTFVNNCCALSHQLNSFICELNQGLQRERCISLFPWSVSRELNLTMIPRHDSGNGLIDCVQQTISLLLARICGQPISIRSLCVQVNILCESLAPMVSGSISMENLWVSSSDMISQLVSLLIELCSSFNDTEPCACELSIFCKNIIWTSSKLIGILGVPDLHLVQADRLPYLAGNSILQSDGDERALRRELMRASFWLVWREYFECSSAARVALRECADNGQLHFFQTDNSDSTEIHLCRFLGQSSPRIISSSNSEDNVSSFWPPEDAIWNPSGKSYNLWVTRLTQTLIFACYGPSATNDRPKVSENYLISFSKLSRYSSKVAEIILPLIFSDILRNNNSRSPHCSSISDQIKKYFFNSSIGNNRRAGQLICHSMVFLLRQAIRRGQSSSDCSQWQSFSYDFNPLDIATCAMNCGLGCVAQLFLELLRDNSSIQADCRPVDNQAINHILCSILPHGHDPDALYGISSSENSLLMQALQYESTNQWLEALSTYESIRQCNDSLSTLQQDARLGVKHSLMGIGVDQNIIGNVFNDRLPDNVLKDAETSLQSWGNLEIACQNVMDLHTATREEYISRLLQCSKSNTISDLLYFSRNVCSGSSALLQRMQQGLLQESARGILVDIAVAQQFVEIFEVFQFVESSSSSLSSSSSSSSSSSLSLSKDSQDILISIYHSWCYRQKTISDNTLQNNSLFASRIQLLGNLLGSTVSNIFPVVFDAFECILDSASNKHAAHALSPLIYRFREEILRCFRQRADIPLCFKIRWQYLEAKLMWTKEQFQSAQQSLNQNVLSQFNKSNDRSLVNSLKTDVLLTAASWASTSKSMSGLKIAAEYLTPALASSSTSIQIIRCHTVLYNLYSDLYNSSKNRTNSKEWEQGERVAAARRSEFERCKQLTQQSKEKVQDKALLRHYHTLRKEIDMDEHEKKQLLENIQSFLLSAVKSVCIVLKESPTNDVEVVLQLVNLWLSNCQKTELNGFLYQELIQIPSYKFVTVSYQLFSRLNDVEVIAGSSNFQATLSNLILKICVDHPHHTVPQLFALANTAADTGGVRPNETVVGRSRAANAVLEKLLRHANDCTRDITFAMKSLLNGYIWLAKVSVESFKSNHKRKIYFKELPEHQSNSLLDCLWHAKQPPSVITNSIPVRSDGHYADIPVCRAFVDNFTITESGISRPKIIECLGSDGRSYKQLVKNGDDMRQDAVMQQVFEFVNGFFSRNEVSRKRHLNIRTYRIVPTTPQTGVLQWVDNTIPFGSYLSEKGTGAHSRYFPNDWTHTKCRDFMNEVPANEVDSKLRQMQEIFRHIRPVFRYFFLENYAVPSTWLARRLTYTKSVAAASIVGYILGIGDRHAQNILIDVQTAEVIHIDFGIVFEQGKGLGIPETVPFRLTRDIVDAMGINECEGTFRQCCETTLEVLRKFSHQILIILEVVIHDPLYKWSLSPHQARLRQPSTMRSNPDVLNRLREDDADNATNTHFSRDAGERALNRIKAKLAGFEDPTGDALSIQGQVHYLISEARAVENLCKIFAGWAPWL